MTRSSKIAADQGSATPTAVPNTPRPPSRCLSLALASTLLLGVGCLVSSTATHAQVSGQQEISDTEGNFTGTLDLGDQFGWAPEAIGDLDGDGVNDLAVGTPSDDDGGINRGAVWILFLNPDGTVKSHQKISDTEGNFTGILDDGDEFGHSVAPLGDYDNDGVDDLAVGALWDDDGGPDRGAFYLLFLDTDGTVKSHQKISDTEGGFTGVLQDNDGFGHGVTLLGDLDNDGIDDLAAATGHISHEGVTWILFMNAGFTVRTFQRIAEGEGGFSGVLEREDELGHDLDALGDFDGDGVLDLLAGVPKDDDGGTDRGGLYLLFLHSDGTVKSHQKISDTTGGFAGILDDGDRFGHPPKNAGDLDGDGVIDLLAGAPFDDDGANDVGAFWILYLEDDGTVRCYGKVSATEGGFSGSLPADGLFSHIVDDMGDLNGDGAMDFVAGAPAADGKGVVWILFGDGTNATFAATFGVATSGLQAIFTDGSTSCGSQVVDWSWDFGDGFGSTQQHPTHTFASEGVYTATLTVEDGLGGMESTSQVVSVEAMRALPESVDFGDQEIGSVSVPDTLTIANDGAGPVDVTTVSMIGQDSDHFGHDFVGPVTIPGGSQHFFDVWFAPISNGTGQPLYRVNAGGPLLPSQDDEPADWEADAPSPYVNSSETNSASYPGGLALDASVPAGSPPELFETYRRTLGSTSMQWDFPVQAGLSLEVRLYFAQWAQCSVGAKVFDVEIEGAVVLDDYDLIADAGCSIAVSRTFSVTPGDTNLDIDFVRVAGGPPLVNAIEILTTSQRTAQALIEYDATNASLVVSLSGNAVASTGDLPPTAAFSFVTNGLQVDLTDQSSDSDGTIETWYWDFGDGNTSIEQNPSHLYAASGTFLVTLTVTDDSGLTDTASDSVTVSDGSSQMLYRVNTGGPLLPAQDGVPVDWEADTPSPYVNSAETKSASYAGGLAIDASVPAGSPPELFETYRRNLGFGTSMQWDLPVQVGLSLEVRLFFAQWAQCSVGAKIFDVEIEGAVVLDDYDLIADAGCSVVVSRTFSVTPNDTNLDIDFVRVVGGPPLVNAIEVSASGSP